MLYLLALLSVLTVSSNSYGQSNLKVEVRSASTTVADASVTINGSSHVTNANGMVQVSVPTGNVHVLVVKEGFAPAETTVSVTEGQPQHVIVELHEPLELEETVTVAATRTEGRLEDQPMRVEVLVREEIEEKMLMTPGDIVMMLNEMGGMRVQATSPSLGAASVRIQGMQGRYTRFFSDGLPLFGEVGGLGLLQIPPMDLGQVEVIKGVASSMYGAGAMGGVVNLISRKPGSESEREVLLNRSYRGGTDAVLWLGTPLANKWSMSTLVGGHWQERTDVNDDGWLDLPGYSRGVVRPRIVWNDGSGKSFFATTGFTYEDRDGGTTETGLPVAIGRPYREALETVKWDVGLVGQTLWRQRFVVTARAAASGQNHKHAFGDVSEDDQHGTSFGELAIRGSSGVHTWVVGTAFERNSYTSDQLPAFNFSFSVPGVFVQDDIRLADWASLSASARADYHNEYGFFVSPRLAALFRAGEWNSRISVGTGFFGPSVLTEETEAAGLTRLRVPVELRAEIGRSASIDISRSHGAFSYTLTGFASRIDHPLTTDRSAGLTLTNSPEPTTNTGIELLGTLRHEPFALTGTYTYVRSREYQAGETIDAELTPRHSSGVVGMWERENVGRVGVEWYVTGAQRLEQNPYRERSKPYMVFGVLAEKQFGRVRLFINGENLTGVMQTNFDPLVRPTRAPDGRWSVDSWAPLEGRNVNGGVRLRF